MAAPKGNTNAEILEYVSIDEIRDKDKKDWESEKEFCDYLEINIENICLDLLDEKYICHQREFQIYRTTGRTARRIDFLITTDKGNVLCEVKRPTESSMQMFYAVSQILLYLHLAEIKGIKIHRSIILTNDSHEDLTGVINKFQLPIEIYIVGKKQLYKHVCP